MNLPRPYIVRKDSWYAERTVWGIAGAFLSLGTLLAWQVDTSFVLVITGTGMFSLLTAFTGFCVMSTALLQFGWGTHLRDEPVSWLGRPIYRMKTDSWYLERGIYLVVGTTQTVGSVLAVVHSPWWLAFTGFVGAMSIGFAYSGFCPVANALYFLGFEPRLAPSCAVRAAPAEALPARA